MFVLDQPTWSPVNTQNTSVVRELIPAFVFVTMAWAVPGGKLDRYGDIWGGYFLIALMQGTNHHVAFGRPLVDHRRNPHNYVDDLRYEFWGMILTDWLLDILRSSFKPTSSKMTDRVLELAEFLDAEAVKRLPAWCPPEITQLLELHGQESSSVVGGMLRLGLKTLVQRMAYSEPPAAREHTVPPE